jgi:hypothetical protein
VPTSNRPSFDLPESVLLQWVMKAFLVGLFLGAAAAINAFVSS